MELQVESVATEEHKLNDYSRDSAIIYSLVVQALEQVFWSKIIHDNLLFYICMTIIPTTNYLLFSFSNDWFDKLGVEQNILIDSMPITLPNQAKWKGHVIEYLEEVDQKSKRDEL